MVAAIRRVVRDGLTVEIRRRPFHVADAVAGGKTAGRDALRRRKQRTHAGDGEQMVAEHLVTEVREQRGIDAARIGEHDAFVGF